LAQAIQANAVERFDGIVDSLAVAPQAVGNLWGRLSPGTGQENLATMQDEGIGRALACLQALALGVGYGTHKDWWHHAVYCNISQNILSEDALGRQVVFIIDACPQKHMSIARPKQTEGESVPCR
jgi:hypothetical protein